MSKYSQGTIGISSKLEQRQTYFLTPLKSLKFIDQYLEGLNERSANYLIGLIPGLKTAATINKESFICFKKLVDEGILKADHFQYCADIRARKYSEIFCELDRIIKETPKEKTNTINQFINQIYKLFVESLNEDVLKLIEEERALLSKIENSQALEYAKSTKPDLIRKVQDCLRQTTKTEKYRKEDQEEISRLVQENQDLMRQNTKLEQQVSESYEKLANQIKTSEKKEYSVDYEIRIEELNKRLAEQDKKLTEQKQIIADKEEEIDELRVSIEQAEGDSLLGG